MGKARVYVCLLLLFISWEVLSVKATVTYDSKGLTIDGKKRILFSGSVHYPRSPPEMWPDIIQKAKDGGLDVIDTYVFWNGHEPTKGQYNFEGRFDLIRFLKVVQKAGLYVSLRIGPYACAEWNFGGFPVWLKYIPGIEFRTINGPFQAEMQKFTQKIVSMLKEEKMFQPQGGPVILSQIENEYELVEWELGPTGRAYTQWAAEMAVGLNTSVPWIMCKQESAPDPVINTCNGYYCEGFIPNKPYKPKFATELWTGWVQLFGGPTPYRPVEDLTYSVAQFVANGGSYSNYYMYYGGTSFDRNSGAFVATSYHYGAPIDEYGLPIEPNWSHLRNMHLAMKASEPALVSSDPIVTWPGRNQEVRVFKSASGACAAFLGNYDEVLPQKVTFGDMQYDLPPWSISILSDCKTEVFNTAKVTVPTAQKQMIPVVGFIWESYVEGVASFTGNRTFTKDGLMEQLDMTRDKTDYLWYMTEVNIDPSEAFLNNGKDPILSIRSGSHVLNVFINDQPAGVAHGNLGFPEASFSQPVKLRAGVNWISILSAIVGLQNIGLHFEKLDKGVIGPVSLSGLNEGIRELSKQKWTYQIGLNGEALSLPYAKDSSSVKWVQGTSIVVGQPLMWYKSTFDAPAGNEPLALDMSSMQKGLIWINGQNIGRHWPAFKSINIGECNGCSYAGLMNATKCVTNCGQPSQIWYHVPRAWLKPKGNQLVVFEEWGGDPTKISLVKRTVI